MQNTCSILEVIMKVGDRAYIVENNISIRDVIITRISGSLVLVKFSYGKGIQIHRNRIYGSRDSALKAIGKQFENKIVQSKDKLKWNAQML